MVPWQFSDSNPAVLWSYSDGSQIVPCQFSDSAQLFRPIHNAISRQVMYSYQNSTPTYSAACLRWSGQRGCSVRPQTVASKLLTCSISLINWCYPYLCTLCCCSWPTVTNCCPVHRAPRSSDIPVPLLCGVALFYWVCPQTQIVRCHNLPSHGTNETSDLQNQEWPALSRVARRAWRRPRKGKWPFKLSGRQAVCVSAASRRTRTRRTLSGHSEYRYLYISVLVYDWRGRGGITPHVLRYVEVGSCDISASCIGDGDCCWCRVLW